MRHIPKHKALTKSAEYIDLEVANHEAFIEGQHLPLVGRRHLRGADSVVRVYELEERAHRKARADLTAAAVERIAA